MADSHRWRIALLIKESGHIVLTRVPRPQPFPPVSTKLSEYFAFPNVEDSDLWELPCLPFQQARSSFNKQKVEPLQTLQEELEAVVARAACNSLDVVEIIQQVQKLISPLEHSIQFCNIWKVLDDPEFGPGRPYRTIFVSFQVKTAIDGLLPEHMQRFTEEMAESLLHPKGTIKARLGPLATMAFFQHNLNDFTELGQQHPSGMMLVPVESRTLPPFQKTNLVIWSPMAIELSDRPEAVQNILSGDALIMDPGCYSRAAQDKMVSILTSLPDRLLVFLTHHHRDHVDGIPTVIKNNPKALVLAHALTLKRIKKFTGIAKCIAVAGGSVINVRGLELEVIAAPGHTDGHLALFHRPTRVAVVGDHCVGEGSSIMDIHSGGNLHDYLSTSLHLIELAPSVIVPMHGYPNFWPIHMLKGYIRHREVRAAKILDAIEEGSRTATEIVSTAYKEAPIFVWPLALMNVMTHVEHFEGLKELPSDFSYRAFQKSCGIPFAARYFLKAPILSTKFLLRHTNPTLIWISGLAMVLLAFSYAWF